MRVRTHAALPQIPEDVRRQLEGLGTGGGASGSSSSGGLLGEPDSDAANELLRFPLSMAKPREDSDHRGERCTGACRRVGWAAGTAGGGWVFSEPDPSPYCSLGADALTP